MIRVDQITKRYGETTAVDGLSFEVDEGEIVGMLGPNGAGKSTTLRILTGYLAATRGTASVAGHDVFEQSIEARRAIGYLPESVPLYEELRVTEYLRFRARLKGVPRRSIGVRVGESMERVDLKPVARKAIGRLSKGYRQRVGIAAALLHEPQVLILDEPTVGLDPSQIRTTRHFIRELAGDHTILLSSHILPEIEATCDRVMILHRGKRVAMDTPRNLVRALEGGGEILAEARGDAAAVRRALEGSSRGREFELTSTGPLLKIRVPGSADDSVEDAAALREEIADAIVASGAKLRELRTRNATLEEVFVRITTEEGSP